MHSGTDDCCTRAPYYAEGGATAPERAGYPTSRAYCNREIRDKKNTSTFGHRDRPAHALMRRPLTACAIG